MNTLSRQIQECTTLADVDHIFAGMRIRPTFRKTVETAVMLKSHADPNQRSIGQQFLRSAIQEAEMGEDAVTAPAEGKGLKTKGDKFVQEEELDNHNSESGNKGGEQSSDNVEPYPQVAENSEDGSKDMEKMDDTENQMKEGFPPQNGMPQPPPMGMPPMGLEPQVANEMGQGMPQLPPMNTNQMMRQMQYTINETLKRVVQPLRNELKVHRETIKTLSRQIREVEAGKSSMKLDIGSVRENAMARTMNPIHETVTNVQSLQGQPMVHHKIQELESARADISDLDKLFRNQK